MGGHGRPAAGALNAALGADKKLRLGRWRTRADDLCRRSEPAVWGGGAPAQNEKLKVLLPWTTSEPVEITSIPKIT
jgi:hypothetical protein